MPEAILSRTQYLAELTGRPLSLLKKNENSRLEIKMGIVQYQHQLNLLSTILAKSLEYF